MATRPPKDPSTKRKPKSSWQLPPEVEAVLRASTNLKPCEPKYGRLPYDKFLEHIRNDRCAQCRAFLLQLDKEQRMMAYLREHKN
jgi:hypothetical protein